MTDRPVLPFSTSLLTRRATLVALALAVGLATGCGSRSAQPAPSARGATTSAGRPIGAYTLVALLTPLVPFMTAQASIAGGTTPGEVRAILSVAGSDPGRQHPWHIHRGSCQVPEVSPVGPAAAYRLLDIRADGRADLNQVIKVDLNPLAAYYADIHLSSQRLDVIIACGNLNRM